MGMNEKRVVVKITYWDHVGVQGELKFKEVEETEPLKCIIYGELLREDDQFITVLAYQEEPEDLVRTEFWAMVILKSTIISRVELEAKK